MLSRRPSHRILEISELHTDAAKPWAYLNEQLALVYNYHVGNQKSWEILRSQRTVTLLEPRLKKAVRSRKEPDDWNGVDRQLFDHLRLWRRKIADGRGKPAWTILDDRALRSIAREKPDTLATLLQCKGIGEKRLDVLIKNWQDYRSAHEVMMFLQRFGVGPKRAIKIYQTYQVKA